MMATNEKDLATIIVPDHAQTWDKAVERRAVRKIDLALLPLMVIGYSFQWYDKAILGGAAIFGMSKDLHLAVVNPETHKTSTERLSWATSIFYFGMLAGLFPLTFLFQRFHVGRTVGVFIVLWGIIAMSTAGVTTYKGLYAQRFFLGFLEACIPTCFMTVVSGYYTQAEQTSRQCIWYASTGSGAIMGGLLNFGFAHVKKAPLSSWKYVYLFAGSVTVLLGIVFSFVPNSPAEAWFLTDEEKIVAVERLRAGQLGMRCQKIKWEQVREGLLDLKVWIITVMFGICYVINGALTGFGPLIVSTLGWSIYDSLLLQLGPAALAMIAILLVGYLSLKIKNARLLMLALSCLPVIAGCVMIWKSTWYHRAAVPIVGYTLLFVFAATAALIVSLAMVNVAGASKKSYVASLTWLFYAVGNIVGPQLIDSKTVGQHYPKLWTAIIVCYVLLIVLSGLLFLLLRRQNKKRDLLNLDQEERDRIAFDDLTDMQNMHFRYVY